jgi:ubiquitin carboxyl-terminal hydrolase 36/42
LLILGSGLLNLGNTCFLNAALQCLTYTPQLASYLSSGKHSATCMFFHILSAGRVSRCMLCIFQRHIQKCFAPSKRPFAPNEIVSKLKVIAKSFRQGRQEDSHEFIRLFIDALVKPALHGLDHLDHDSKV